MTKNAKYPIEDAFKGFVDEFRLWLKDWRSFLLTMPKNKNERIFWFLISTIWIASWTSVILSILSLLK